MTKYQNIGGMYFEVIRSSKVDDMLDWHNNDYLGRRTLYDFYDNPSAIKENIWDEWLGWQAANYPTVSNMRVTGASCFTFSIGAYYCDPETYEILGYFRITRNHNRLYLYK